MCTYVFYLYLYLNRFSKFAHQRFHAVVSALGLLLVPTALQIIFSVLEGYHVGVLVEHMTQEVHVHVCFSSLLLS